jgi:hypothetical protein
MGLLLWLLGLPGVVALAWTVPPAWLAALAEAAGDCGGWAATAG